jgi:hypothetical protein
LFLHFFIYLFKKLQFILIVALRFVKVLCRKSWKIQRLHLNYYDEELFDDNYLIVNYRFRNALFYRLGNQYIIEKQLKILNVENFDNTCDLVVYGIFTKKVYRLKFKYELNHAKLRPQPRFNNPDTEFVLQGISDLRLS